MHLLLELRNAHTLTNMNAGERETAHKTFPVTNAAVTCSIVSWPCFTLLLA
jgi:hypothetical protein